MITLCDFQRENDAMVCSRADCRRVLHIGRPEWGPETYRAVCRTSQHVIRAGTTPPDPSIVRKCWSYAKAMARWGAAGMPTREQAEIDRILAICQACEFYADKKGKPHCGKCGCALNRLPDGLANKIAMLTESCPLDPPKWH